MDNHNAENLVVIPSEQISQPVDFLALDKYVYFSNVPFVEPQDVLRAKHNAKTAIQELKKHRKSRERISFQDYYLTEKRLHKIWLEKQKIALLIEYESDIFRAIYPDSISVKMSELEDSHQWELIGKAHAWRSQKSEGGQSKRSVHYSRRLDVQDTLSMQGHFLSIIQNSDGRLPLDILVDSKIVGFAENKKKIPLAVVRVTTIAELIRLTTLTSTPFSFRQTICSIREYLESGSGIFYDIIRHVNNTSDWDFEFKQGNDPVTELEKSVSKGKSKNRAAIAKFLD